MHTRFLQTLVRIRQIGSFSKVADDLNTTLSTVSMQMKALEDELGVELFDRNFRPPSLTPLGQKITDHAEELLRAERNLKEACGGAGQLTGTFRLGFVATASVRLLPAFLEQASRYAPEADFRFETALSESLEQRVRAGHLDAAVVTDTGEKLVGLSVINLRDETIKFAIPRSLEGIGERDLFSSIPFLQFNPGSGIGRLIESKVQEIDPVGKSRRIVLDSVEAIMACVNNGIGFTLLAEPDIQRYSTQAILIRPLAGERFIRKLSLISAPHQYNSRNAELLANLFRHTDKSAA